MHALELSKHLNYVFESDAFYMPSFGPVYSHGEEISDFVSDVLNYENNRNPLPYDKSNRWYDQAPEYVVSKNISPKNDILFIPVIRDYKNINLKLYVYTKDLINSDKLHNISELALSIQSELRIESTSVFSNQQIDGLELNQTTILYRKDISVDDEMSISDESVSEYSSLPAELQDTFQNLVEDTELYGSQMLWFEYLSKGTSIGTIIVAVEEDKIVGMIGPLDIINDAWGYQQLLPPYFEVHSKFRQKGIGRKLWNAAMNWAYRNGATYKLFQADEDEPANLFYQKLGLTECHRLYRYSLD